MFGGTLLALERRVLKCLPVTNTLAYSIELLMAAKKCIELAFKAYQKKMLHLNKKKMVKPQKPLFKG
jgi:hypothetical protein